MAQICPIDQNPDKNPERDGSSVKLASKGAHFCSPEVRFVSQLVTRKPQKGHADMKAACSLADR